MGRTRIWQPLSWPEMAQYCFLTLKQPIFQKDTEHRLYETCGNGRTANACIAA
ncbi:hypothetical protein OF001_U390014 [Pseudomonas sp. OF001]|nr:hypothetical protein OF001_U390014 [Pseudomonas sp. OF001]